jgi:hypothetical protein
MADESRKIDNHRFLGTQGSAIHGGQKGEAVLSPMSQIKPPQSGTAVVTPAKPSGEQSSKPS